MSEQPQHDRVTEAGYLGISAASDDVIDTDDLYEALINPHGGSGGKPNAGGAPMMMPPMMGMGAGGGGGAAGGAGGGFTAAAASTGVRAPGGMTGAGGAGLGATPPPPGSGVASGGGAGGGGADLPDFVGGGGPAGADLPLGGSGAETDGVDGPGLGTDGVSGGALGSDAAPTTATALGKPIEPTAHAGEVLGQLGDEWSALAQAWPAIVTELDSLTRQGADLFGLVHEAEHGFNEAHQWLVSRAREAVEASNSLGDTLAAARRDWAETEAGNVTHVKQIDKELTR